MNALYIAMGDCFSKRADAFRWLQLTFKRCELKSASRSPEEGGSDQISFVFCSCNRGGDNGKRWRLALLLSEDLQGLLSILLV
ncbi:hypothetical protein QLQ09_00890 [Brucella sp. NM4]|uniref:hypothetical protein n=1 Tax=Brucella sp. NM4 TaxID=3045175 RepID=UPI0024BD00D5|nr:hypothetical protein [Brucella sp. NM4]WHS30655.1 hypothetical protein QLQ09_00890 [Brucella sp. NM4]